MSLQYRTLDSQAYQNKRFNLIAKSEGNKSFPYYDTKHLVTIGIGFNISGAGTVQNAVFSALGLGQIQGFSDAIYISQLQAELAIKRQDSDANQQLVLSKLNNILANRYRAIQQHFNSLRQPIPAVRTAFSLTSTEREQIFNNIIETYETKVNTWLSGIPESEERVALVSLAYNTGNPDKPLLGSNLKAAIQSENRVEAWFEIRYRSNGDKIQGIANRRYEESKQFGLYFDRSKVTEEEARDVYRMYSKYKNPSENKNPSESFIGIDAYDDKYKSRNSRNTEFWRAEQFLIKKYDVRESKSPNIQQIIIDPKTTDTESNTLDPGDNSSTIDLIFGEQGNDTIYGRGNEDLLYGEAGNDVLDGGTGNDILNGGLDIDVMRGGSGDDIYYVDSIYDQVQENSGEGTEDIVKSSLANYTLPNHVEELRLEAGALNGTGNELDNLIVGNELNNQLQGGAGNDFLVDYGGSDTYVYNLGDGSDGIYDFAGFSSQSGIAINSPNDVLRFGTGINPTDIIYTGIDEEGYTTFRFRRMEETSTLDIFGIERAEFADGTAWDVVNLASTFIQGDSGNNVLIGTDRNNTLIGEAGDDTLDGGLGNDTMIGGMGNDTYIVDSTGDVVTEKANQGIDIVQSSISYTLAANVEKLTLTGTALIRGIGNNLNNVITGNSGNNTLNGGLGNDTMIGGMGNDTYIVDSTGDVVTEKANQGIDIVQSSISYRLAANVEKLTLTGTALIRGIGNNLNNVITGNSSNNILNGGLGQDTLIGGLGKDIYVFRFGESAVSAPDKITDFAIGRDKIDLLTQGGAAVGKPIRLTRAKDSTANTLPTLVNQVFADANGGLIGNQGLGVNSAALVRVTSGSLAGTYIMVNDAVKGFQASSDLLLNLTGYTGNLPNLGTVSVDSFFV